MLEKVTLQNQGLNLLQLKTFVSLLLNMWLRTQNYIDIRRLGNTREHTENSEDLNMENMVLSSR